MRDGSEGHRTGSQPGTSAGAPPTTGARMRNRSLSTIIATTVVMAASLLLAPSAAAAKPAPKPQRPEVISLPHGFMPEGISISGDQFFVGSRANGALYRGSLRTGQGAELVP